MFADEFVGELVRLIPTAIGAALAILGGRYSQIQSHRLADERERSTHHRSRVESFARAIFASRQWLEEKKKYLLVLGKDHTQANPLDEGEMLQLLYFPQLLKKFSEMKSSQMNCELKILELRQLRLDDFNTFVNESKISLLNESQSEYLQNVDQLLEQTKELLKRTA
jgi:hypothetical protein